MIDQCGAHRWAPDDRKPNMAATSLTPCVCFLMLLDWYSLATSQAHRCPVQARVKPAPDCVGSNDADHCVRQPDVEIVCQRQRRESKQRQDPPVRKEVDYEANQDIEKSFDK
jgi:hypothetical protein